MGIEAVCKSLQTDLWWPLPPENRRERVSFLKFCLRRRGIRIQVALAGKLVNGPNSVALPF